MNARAVVLPLVAVAAFTAIWVAVSDERSDAPAATWRLGSETDFRQAQNYEEYQPATPLRLSFVGTSPMHVYVFSHSAEDGTLLMFPSPKVKSDLSNPLPVGRSTLPGRREEQSVHWAVRDDILATTTYVVAASKQPIAELEELLPRLRRWTNTSLQDGTMQVTNPDDGEVDGAPRDPMPSPLLQRAAERARTETIVNGPLHADTRLEGVWIGGFCAREKKAAPHPK